MIKQIIPLNEREETISNMRYVEGWNAAIEAVVEVATSDYHVTAEEIRKLKK